MRMQFRSLLSIIVLLAVPLLSTAQDFRGRCLGVSSGDTLEVLKGPRRLTVHLAGVVAPAPAQPRAEESRAALAAAALNRELMVSEKYTDRGGVIHAVVRAAADATATLNAAMIGGGLAWSDPATRLVKGLDEAENQARAAGRGLWADPNPLPPWEWRELATAGKLPAPAEAPEEKKPFESAFDRLVQTPHYGDSNEGLLKAVIETRKRHDAAEENARQAAILRRQQAFNPYYGLDSFYGGYGYDPYFNYGGMGMWGGRSSSSLGGIYGGGTMSYFPQGSVRTTPYSTIIAPDFNTSLRRFDW